MLALKSRTESDWLARAIADPDAILLDHAHCERKAANNALKLLGDYPEERALVAPLCAIAREELEHFERVMAILSARGLTLVHQEPSGYQRRLFKKVRGAEPDALCDKLLCAALIEARSCERFGLLAEHHPDAELRALFSELLASEARHYADFVRLAEGVVGREAARARLGHLAEVERRAIEAAKRLPRMHA
jgi:tRNA-(ms[2]io[6]A)-hydroxylase